MRNDFRVGVADDLLTLGFKPCAERDVVLDDAV